MEDYVSRPSDSIYVERPHQTRHGTSSETERARWVSDRLGRSAYGDGCFFRQPGVQLVHVAFLSRSHTCLSQSHLSGLSNPDKRSGFFAFLLLWLFRLIKALTRRDMQQWKLFNKSYSKKYIALNSIWRKKAPYKTLHAVANCRHPWYPVFREQCSVLPVKPLYVKFLLKNTTSCSTALVCAFYIYWLWEYFFRLNFVVS